MKNTTIIFEKSQSSRYASAQVPREDFKNPPPSSWLRKDTPLLPELSELEVVRHFTALSQKNYSIDTHFYPLGSCTMKYNPKGIHRLAFHDVMLNMHPLTDCAYLQPWLATLFELQEYLKVITGMAGVSLTPMAGAQGEFAGVLMIRAYHESRGDTARSEMLVPKGAHGTNPATAAMCGYVVRELPINQEGNLDLHVLKEWLGPRTAGIMLTNPSTLGVFEKEILEISKCVHDVGGLLYYDGANLNAILGKIRPADMGFDVMHMNMHKTFATPHGGGGPGSGPIAANERLQPFLPIPMVNRNSETGTYHWLSSKERPFTIGRLSGFMGNAAILWRAYLYIRLLGKEGLTRISIYATLNANYLKVKLAQIGYKLAFPTRLATHEFIITLAAQAKQAGVRAQDVAKMLLDEGFYAPTTYFPLFIPECLLIEPTETESKQTLDAFVEAMQRIWLAIQQEPEKLLNAPSRLPCKRLDETKAARELKLVWQPDKI